MLSRLFRDFGVLALCCCALFAPARADDASEIDSLFRAGQTDEAFSRLQQLLAAKPRDPSLRFVKGVLLARAGRVDEALSTLEELTADHPELPEPYNNLAVLHASQGEFEKARVALEAALRARPGYALAHRNLGDVYAHLARRAYTQALQLDPDDRGVAPKLSLLREVISLPSPSNPPATP